MTTSNTSISQDALLRLNDVRAITGMGKTLIYRLIKNNQFPRQIHPAGARMSTWRKSEIDNWIEEQARNCRETPECVSSVRKMSRRR